MATYDKGLIEIAEGSFAYLQPDGGWGWSNAGLLTSAGKSLLIDTLFDLRLTQEMLDSMSPITASAPISQLVNTHANGDHCYGNELVLDADIIASAACAAEMLETPPAVLERFMAAAPKLGQLGEYLVECFGEFHFEGITLTPPTVTFEHRLDVTVGDLTVELHEVGPAHTAGDVIAYVPDTNVVYTGDILFIDGTPLMWAGPISNWIAACDLIVDFGADTIVPGHGPLTDADGVRRVREYLSYIDAEARTRHSAGMSVDDAAADISLGEFADWIDSERVAINVNTIYGELDSSRGPTDVATLFTMMAKLAI